MNKKIIIILFFCFIIILAWIIYYFIPRYNAGYLNNIGELEDKYPLCHITNFKSKGRLIFIEKRQWSSWTIVVFGKFDDDINIFKDDRRGRNIRKFNSISSFFIYSYAYGYKDASFPDGLKLPIRNVTTSDSEYGEISEKKNLDYLADCLRGNSFPFGLRIARITFCKIGISVG